MLVWTGSLLTPQHDPRDISTLCSLLPLLPLFMSFQYHSRVSSIKNDPLQGVPMELESEMRRMLAVDPSYRPTASDFAGETQRKPRKPDCDIMGVQPAAWPDTQLHTGPVGRTSQVGGSMILPCTNWRGSVCMDWLHSSTGFFFLGRVF